jgi:hypothetical protein
MRSSDNCNFSHRIPETKHDHKSPELYEDLCETISAVPASVQRP